MPKNANTAAPVPFHNSHELDYDGIFAFSKDEEKKDLGKALLIYGLVMIVLGVLVALIWS